LAIANRDGQIVFRIEDMPIQNEDVSFGFDLAGERRYFAAATPGESNAINAPTAPSINLKSRTFTASVIVELEAASASHTIHYTLDERSPSRS
jgi:hypothetical protein